LPLPFLTVFGHDLDFWPVTLKSYNFTFLPRCIKVVNLVKFPQVVDVGMEFKLDLGKVIALAAA